MVAKILLAYNGSREGKTGLLSCAQVCAFTKAEAHLLAVASVAPTMFASEAVLPGDLMEDEKKRMQEVLDEGVEQLRQRGFRATGHLAVGEPVDEISRVARDVEADIIIVGHEQKGSRFKRWWRGSVGKKLIDTAPCSVLIALPGN